jgi:hypothetical protein
VLEPDAHSAAKVFKEALVSDGIPYTSFAVDDVAAEYARLERLGVRFTQQPAEMGPVITDREAGSLRGHGGMTASLSSATSVVDQR